MGGVCLRPTGWVAGGCCGVGGCRFSPHTPITHPPSPTPLPQKFPVHNVAELDMLLMHNRKYCAEIAGPVSVRTRRAIVARAAQLNVRVTNAAARLRATE